MKAALALNEASTPMNKSFFAVALTASFAGGLLARPASAQMQTGQVFTAPQTINPSYSAGQAEYNRRELERKFGSKRAPNESSADYGRRLIESGRATTKFQTRPFPLASYMKTAWNGNAATRRKNLSEWKAQSAIWNAEAKARGAKTNDMGDVYALAIVMSYQAYSGKRVNNTGFRQQAREFSELFGSLSAYQGYSTREKQEFYENAMLLASNALRFRRAGNVTEAKARGTEFLNSWAKGKLPGALEVLAPYVGA